MCSMSWEEPGGGLATLWCCVWSRDGSQDSYREVKQQCDALQFKLALGQIPFEGALLRFVLSSMLGPSKNLYQ